MLPMSERLRGGVEELRTQGMDALIIDLRGNPGGVGAMSIPIARMFVREGASLGVLQMREFNQEFNVEPNPDAFDGPIVILVDEGTASTSEIFAVGMRDIGRVTIVGAGPSAGMALPSMIETLPDGGLIQYVVGDYHSAKGSAAEGEGVVPSIKVEESRADYAAGRDPVLDAGVGHLRSRVRDSPEPTP
jgi:carboxyl-terminal processing protease